MSAILDGLRENALAIFSGLVAIASSLALIRGKKETSDTDATIEHAKQASARLYIHQLEQAQRDAAELREINRQVREQFHAALTEFRGKLQTSDLRIGELIEQVAELRGENSNLHAQLEALRDAIAAGERAHADELQQWRHRHGTLEERYRILVNEKYGDGTATNIMGRAE